MYVLCECYVLCILTYDYRVILQLVFWKAPLWDNVCSISCLCCLWTVLSLVLWYHDCLGKSVLSKSRLMEKLNYRGHVQQFSAGERMNPLPDKPYVLCFGICFSKCQEDWWPILAGNILGKKRTNNTLVRIVAQERQTIPLLHAHHCA